MSISHKKARNDIEKTIFDIANGHIKGKIKSRDACSSVLRVR